MNNVFLLFSLVICLFVKDISTNFVDVTSKLFGSQKDGVISAFGDFNSDKLTDIFLLTENGRKLEILYSHEQLPYSQQVLTEVPPGEQNATKITGVFPGDYDGDSLMDVLITESIDGTDRLSLKVYWGTGLGVEKDHFVFPERSRDHPTILDYNADMIPDLLTETTIGNRYVWIATGSRNFTQTRLPAQEGQNISYPMRHPHSNAFIDVNDDLTADLIIDLDGTKGHAYERWVNIDGALTFNGTTPSPPLDNPATHTGQSAFVDIDQDGSIDHIVPLCLDAGCKQSQIWAHTNGNWNLLTDTFTRGDLTWGFVPPALNPAGSPKLAITLRMGDYNLDGYPDALAVLYMEAKGERVQRAVLLENVGCSKAPCQSAGRTLAPHWGTVLDTIDGVIIAAFYDIYSDVIPDVLVNHIDNTGKTKVLALKNSFNADATFLKVMVLSGLCESDCKNPNGPYGINQPGAFIRYRTTTTDGKPQVSCAGQLSQAAHFALQLPFTVFGLGQTPNFIDNLQVGIPYPPNKEPRIKSWTSVIPNSQIIVIPSPLDQPRWWKMKLFVTPSRLVMLTGASLLGTCGFIAALIGILHWKERRDDKKEKRQEAHRFHFDAM